MMPTLYFFIAAEIVRDTVERVRPGALESYIPALPIMVLDVLVRLGSILGTQALRIPCDFLLHAIGHIAKQRGFSQRPGIIKVARRLATGLDRVHPFFVM